MNEPDLQQARANMLKQQLRTWHVLDERLLDAYLVVARELFLPSNYAKLAYADVAVPVALQQTLLPPKEEARLLQAAAVQAGDKVLVLGGAVGFTAALLAQLANQVFSVDYNKTLTAQASAHLADLAIKNVRCVTADPLQGLAAEAPFDVIVITSSLPQLPATIKQQLSSQGGRLLAILGEAPAMTAWKWQRLGGAEWRQESLFDSNRERLLPFKDAESFVF